MNLIPLLEKQSQLFWTIGSFTLAILLGLLDYWTGSEISFAFFYLIPISLISWFAGKRLGIIISIISAILWFIADFATGISYSHPLIGYWNATSRLGFFLVVAWLLSDLRMALQSANKLAYTDYMTGALNARFFYKMAKMEISRSHRYGHPFTVAYVDLDNFKDVNDRLGHHIGDRVLRVVTHVITRHMRESDIIARLGGDEFALLLPETGQEAAQMVISKIHLHLLDEMQKNHWPVTFSMGVLICIDPPSTAEEMVMLADKLMYSVKQNGKNRITYSVYQD